MLKEAADNLRRLRRERLRSEALPRPVTNSDANRHGLDLKHFADRKAMSPIEMKELPPPIYRNTDSAGREFFSKPGSILLDALWWTVSVVRNTPEEGIHP
jgi:hypothetical protein